MTIDQSEDSSLRMAEGFQQHDTRGNASYDDNDHEEFTEIQLDEAPADSGKSRKLGDKTVDIPSGTQGSYVRVSFETEGHPNELPSAGGNRGRAPALEKEARKAQASGRLRHIVAVLALSSIVLANMNRQAYNQALVQMVRRPPDANVSSATDLSAATTLGAPLDDIATNSWFDEETTTSQTAIEASTRIEVLVKEDRYEWSGAQVSLLQAAFSYGYTPFMIPGGRLSELYGAKWIVFLSGFGSALCSLLTPFLADHSFTMLVVSRVLMGICQTGVSPALYALLTRWLPKAEASVYLPLIKVAVMLGFMSGSLLNGFLTWRMTFIGVGLVSLAWSLVWTLCVTSEPEQHKFIGASELKFIRQQLGRDTDEKKATAGSETGKSGKTSAPWLRIIFNPVVLAFMFTKFTVKVSTDTQTMQIPMYLKRILHVSDQLNGILNATNFAIQAVFTGLIAYMAKEFVENKTFGLSKTGVRRLFQGINNFGMALAYLLISFNLDSLNIVCGCVILVSISSMFGSGGEAILPIDLTNEYSASIMAIANSSANLSGIVFPAIVSLLLDDQPEDAQRWLFVWWFVSAMMTLGGLSFSFFVKAKIQDFNRSRVEGKGDLPVEQSKRSGSSRVAIELSSRKRSSD